MKELRLQYNKESVTKRLNKNESIVLERYKNTTGGGDVGVGLIIF